MAFHPYLFFSGRCREAFTRYKEIFGGELFLMPMSDMPPGEGQVPEGQGDKILHAALTFADGNMLMASDDPTGDVGKVEGIHVSFEAPDADEARRVFDALAEGGDVTQPLLKTFFSPAFGMCVDRFGIPWMVSAAQADQTVPTT